MDIKAQLLKEHSKFNTLKIIDFVGADKDKFVLLMKIFLGDNYRLTQRASWAVNYCACKHPELLNPYWGVMINQLEKVGLNDAIKRNTFRLMQFVLIPKKYEGRLADITFRYINNNKEPIAVRAFALTTLANIAENHSELKSEIILCIEGMLPGASSGLKNRCLKILDRMQQ